MTDFENQEKLHHLTSVVPAKPEQHQPRSLLLQLVILLKTSNRKLFCFILFCFTLSDRAK